MKPWFIPLGTSAAQDFQLREGDPGSVGNLDGAGLTVALVITRKDGVAIATPPIIDWLDQAGGTVRVTGVEELPVGNYYVRYKLTDTSSKSRFIPGETENEKAKDPYVWTVFTP